MSENKGLDVNENVETEVDVEPDMSAFLPGAAVEIKEVEEIISYRYKDAKGNPIPFRFKPISTERIEELEKECTTYKKLKGQGRVRELDTQRFAARMAIETTVFPNFKSKQFREEYKTQDPVEVAKKVLCVGGEYTRWIEKANDLNGFGDDETLEEMAKNS